MDCQHNYILHVWIGGCKKLFMGNAYILKEKKERNKA